MCNKKKGGNRVFNDLGSYLLKYVIKCKSKIFKISKIKHVVSLNIKMH